MFVYATRFAGMLSRLRFARTHFEREEAQMRRGGSRGGSGSRGASGFHFGTTSDNPRPLTRDEGGAWSGKVRSDHAVDAQHNRPHSRGFQNPQRDFGPPDQISGRSHIDARQATRPQYPAGAGYTKQSDPRGPTWSEGRARSSSADEYFPNSWYGGPSRRQR